MFMQFAKKKFQIIQYKNKLKIHNHKVYYIVEYPWYTLLSFFMFEV